MKRYLCHGLIFKIHLLKDSRYVFLGNEAPQIKQNSNLFPPSLISVPMNGPQTNVVLIKSRAETALQVSAIEWITDAPSSKIKIQV